MNVLALLTLGFAPGIFWLWQIYQRDRYIPAPVHLVVRTFLWGIGISVPVVVVEAALVAVVGFEFGEEVGSNLVQAAYVSFLVAGMTEELAKYLVVRRTVYNSLYFRQPLDGIIFSAAAALGFASIENVGYMFSFGAGVILVRGPFSTLAHVLFSVVWGHTLGVLKQGKVRPYMATLSLLAAMSLHGLFDFLLFAGPSYGPWALVVFFAMGMVFFLLLRSAQRQSPYRDKIAAVLLTCPNCKHQSGYGAGFCTACGHSLALAKSSNVYLCGHCNNVVENSHRFCTTCGSRLDRRLVSAHK